MFSNIKTKWSTTVDDINPEDWISIYGTDIIKSQNFFKANENSGFEAGYILLSSSVCEC